VSYLRRTRGYREETLRALAGLRFTGDVRAVPEGRAGEFRGPDGLAWLPPAARALRDPEPVRVRMSEQLKTLQEQVIRDLRQRVARPVNG
jgi:hypothetical protein